MVPIVRQHPMLLFSRVVCGLIPKSGDKKGMKAAQTSENECRKLVENHFPMSVYFSAKIYPLCELPRKVKSLILKLGRFSFHMTPAEMENMTPSAYHRTAAPSKRTPQLLPVQHPAGAAFPLFSSCWRGPRQVTRVFPTGKVFPSLCEASLFTIPFS